MNTRILSENFKKFRMEKGLTQEAVAAALHINAQTVSRWECGTSMPDILLLPEIAELYGVTVDALYRRNSIAYQNYAQRLASVYEYTHSPEDFLRALVEFQKLSNEGTLSTLDKFCYGYLFDEMFFDCKEKALLWYESVLADGKESDPHSYRRVRSLRARLLFACGQGERLLAEQKEKMGSHADADEWEHLIDLYLYAGQNENAYACFQAAISEYPMNRVLYMNGAEACVALKKYNEALVWYQKAGTLGTEFHDEMFGIAACYEAMGEYEKAIATRQEVYAMYMKEGYEYEAKLCLSYTEEIKQKATPH